VDLLRIVKVVVHLNLMAIGSASSQLTNSQLVADVLGTMNHVVVEGTLLMNSEDVLLLLTQTLAPLIFRQVGEGMLDVILLARPAEVTHRLVHDGVRKKHLPYLPETGVTYDMVA
jgi:hypothetical protein